MAVTRRQFRDTFLIKNVDGTTSPLAGLLLTPYAVDETGARAAAALPAAQIYNDRIAATHPASMQTDANGAIDFWLDWGEYDIKIEDTQVPARVATKYVGFGAMGAGPQSIQASQLPNYGQSLVPAGAFLAWGGAGVNDPAGWLLCDGRLVPTATYAALFAAIGHNYNIVGGVATDPGGGMFRIPDLRGRSPIGADTFGTAAGAAGRLTTANTNANTRGSTGGAEVQTLTAAQLPTHVHNATATAAATGISVNSVGDHAHVEWIANSGGSQSSGAFVGGTITPGPISTFVAGAHGHGITDPTHSHTLTVNDTGQTRNAAHGNVPPYQVAHYIIKT